MTATDVQLPTWEKSASRSAVVISKERLPTKSFLPMESTRFLATSWWPTLHHGPRRVAGRRRTVPLEHTGGFCASVRASPRAVNPSFGAETPCARRHRRRVNVEADALGRGGVAPAASGVGRRRVRRREEVDT